MSFCQLLAERPDIMVSCYTHRAVIAGLLLMCTHTFPTYMSLLKKLAQAQCLGFKDGCFRTKALARFSRTCPQRQSFVPHIGEVARAEEDVNEFKYSQLEYVVCIYDHFIEDTVNTTGLFWVGGFVFCHVVINSM